MDVLVKLDEARAAINVLEHPFYRRWSAGELGAEELALYAGEYRRAVVALADASALAAEAAQPADAPGLRRHAEEESAHVALWDQFARASAERAGAGVRATGTPAQSAERAGSAGPTTGERELPETELCVRAWTAGESLLEHLAVLYAIEAGQPGVSRTKLDGLTAHYGYGEEGPAAEYFRLHEQRDREHADDARELIGRLIADVDDGGETAARMLARATDALRGNWRLLDGVEAAAAAQALVSA